MKAILISAMLFFVPGAMIPSRAQAQREQEKQPEKAQQAKPTQEGKPAQQSKPVAQQTKQPEQAKQPQQVKPASAVRPAQQQAKSSQQQTKPAPPAKSAQPAARHGRIPDDKFRASFGSGHTFHVNHSDFSGASRRFQYGGYSWALINPWPVGWLYTDSVYVDYMNGGYFLCDPVHPGVYLSINIG
jgi:hypothetical protein